VIINPRNLDFKAMNLSSFSFSLSNLCYSKLTNARIIHFDDMAK